MVSEARSWEQGARSGRRERRVIREKGSASRGGESGVEHEHEHEQEDEDEGEGPNVYNCVSLSERQAGALALQRDFRSSILSYSILHTPCSILNAQCSMLNAQCSMLNALCLAQSVHR